MVYTRVYTIAMEGIWSYSEGIQRTPRYALNYIPDDRIHDRILCEHFPEIDIRIYIRKNVIHFQEKKLIAIQCYQCFSH